MLARFAGCSFNSGVYWLHQPFDIPQWSGNPTPKFTQCVGYKRPLFLGGKDAVENLELSEVEVYWHLMGQLIRQAKGLPVGTPVRVP